MKLVFKNPEHILRPGAYVNAFIASDKKVSTLLIPQACVLQDQGGEYVLTVDKDNKVKSKMVELGEIYDEYIAVIKGLKKGELLIKEGLQKVREGEIVKPNIDLTKPDFDAKIGKKSIKQRPNLENNKQTSLKKDDVQTLDYNEKEQNDDNTHFKSDESNTNIQSK